jgi:hypothetical protein
MTIVSLGPALCLCKAALYGHLTFIIPKIYVMCITINACVLEIKQRLLNIRDPILMGIQAISDAVHHLSLKLK